MKNPEQLAREAMDRKFGLGTPWEEPNEDGDEGFVRAMAEGDLDADDLLAVISSAIEADRAQLYPFVLSFEPDAIREHFADDNDDPTVDLTDAQLNSVGQSALGNDRLSDAFHEALQDSIGEFATSTTTNEGLAT